MESKLTTQSIKPGDVFCCRWHQEHDKKDWVHRDYHCFDGQLEAKARNGKIWLVDTYWLDNDGVTFAPEVAEKQGELTFVVNINDLEPINQAQARAYAKEDVFDLSRQHGYYKRFCVRKGAKRNADMMVAAIQDTITHLESEIERKMREVGRLKERIESVKVNPDNDHG